MGSATSPTTYSTDPYAEARERAQLAKRLVDSDMQRMNQSLAKAPLTSARNYYGQNEQGISPGNWRVPEYAMSRTSSLSDSASIQNEMQAKAASSAFGLVSDIKSARDYSEASIAAAEKKASASGTAGIISGIGKIASVALPLALCDARCKHSIAPLGSCEVHDELAELARIVQWLREQP